MSEVDVNIPGANAIIKSGHSNHVGGHFWHGLTDKDQVNINKDVSNANFLNVLNNIAASEIATEKNGAANGLATEKNGAAGVLATSVASGALGVSIEKTSSANQLTTNVVGQNLQNTLLQNFNAASVQAQTFASATNLAIEKTAAAGMLLAVQNAGASALASATTTAAIQAAIAECCCEQKELTTREANATRDLINSLNTANIQQALNIANQEIMMLKIKAPLVIP